jgi:hypothetical protein
VVDVAVREDDGIDRIGRHGKALPIQLSEMLLSLKQSAIDKDPRAPDIEQVPRTRDHSRGAQERDAGSRMGVCRRWGHRVLLASVVRQA